ncbi:MAG: hypothetical protein ACI4UE_02405 [Candidatus Scatovivens sp.]
MKKKRKISLFKLILIVIIIFFVYKTFIEQKDLYISSKIDKQSEWYVNDLYMSNQYYYNNELNDEEKILYKEIFNEIKNNKSSKIVICNEETIIKILDCLMLDHPELINLRGYTYSNSGSDIRIEFFYYDTTEKNIENRVKKVQQKIAEIKKECNDKFDFEKEKYIYEWIGQNSKYGDDSSEKEQSAYYGFFNTTKKVGYGYAKTAQILFQAVNIESYIVKGEEKMWNLVKLDDYYYFDSTETYVVGDSEAMSYIGLNPIDISEYIRKYSLISEPTGTKYNYFDYYGLTVTYTENDLSQLKKIIDNSKYKTVDINISNSQEFVKNTPYSVIEQLGIKDTITVNNGIVRVKKK